MAKGRTLAVGGGTLAGAVATALTAWQLWAGLELAKIEAQNVSVSQSVSHQALLSVLAEQIERAETCEERHR